jgi:hypothetical protein
MILGDLGNYDKLSEETPEFQDFFFVILFFLTIFFVVILLNLLIAIISDSFSKVTSVEKKAFQFERLNLIIEYEEMMSKEEREKMTSEFSGNYLYVIRVNENSGEEAENLKEMKKIKREQMAKINSNIEYNTQMIKNINEETKLIAENSQKNNETISKEFNVLAEKLMNEVKDLKTLLKVNKTKD